MLRERLRDLLRERLRDLRRERLRDLLLVGGLVNGAQLARWVNPMLVIDRQLFLLYKRGSGYVLPLAVHDVNDLHAALFFLLHDAGTAEHDGIFHMSRGKKDVIDGMNAVGQFQKTH